MVTESVLCFEGGSGLSLLVQRRPASCVAVQPRGRDDTCKTDVTRGYKLLPSCHAFRVALTAERTAWGFRYVSRAAFVVTVCFP